MTLNIRQLLYPGAIVMLSIVMFFTKNLDPSLNSMPWIEIFSLIILAFYIRELYKKSPEFLFTSFYQIYALGGVAVSLLFVGAGIPMMEIDGTGSANGAFWIILIFFVFGLEAGKIGFYLSKANYFFRVKKISNRLSQNMVLLISASILAVGLYIFLIYGGAAISGQNRVAFWSSSIPSYLKFYPGLLSQTFFLIAFAYFNNKENRRKNALPILLVIFYFLATHIVAGEKFSAFILYINIWLFLQTGFVERRNFGWRFFAVGAIVLFGLLALVLGAYSILGEDLTFMLSRTAAQGELIWSVLNESSKILLYGDRFFCFFGCDQYNTGADFISARYVTFKMWNDIQTSESNLTGFMPALPILLWGIPLSLIIHVLFSIFFGWMQSGLIKSIKSRDLITSYFLYKIYFGLIIFWYASRISALSGVAISAAILFFWLLIFGRSYKYKPKEN